MVLGQEKKKNTITESQRDMDDPEILGVRVSSMCKFIFCFVMCILYVYVYI